MRKTSTTAVLAAFLAVAFTALAGGAAHADPTPDYVSAGTLAHPLQSGQGRSVVDSAGRLVIADPVDDTLLRVGSGGSVEAPIPLPLRPEHLIAGPAGSVLAWTMGGDLARVDTSGAVSVVDLPDFARWVAVAPTGDLQVTDDVGGIWVQQPDGSFLLQASLPDLGAGSLSYITPAFDDYVCQSSLYELTIRGIVRVDGGRSLCQGMTHAPNGDLVVAWSNGEFVQYDRAGAATVIARAAGDRPVSWDFHVLASGDIVYRDAQQSFYRIAADGAVYEARRGGWRTSASVGSAELDSNSIAVSDDGVLYSINRRGGVDRYALADLERAVFDGYSPAPTVRARSAALTLYPTWSGPASARFTVVSGSIPAGMTLDPVHGDVTGTPTVAGTTTATIRLDPGTGAPAIDRTLTITVGRTATY
ncbi:putative Ig domain-containing protein [Cnuibacter sp. UC19_7]|uniref:putative Ig domain-containing protein n=1 Tax=Cnuibacter sp. UC19_7 TaxID=3350166 RepID=UPI0036732C38